MGSVGRSPFQVAIVGAGLCGLASAIQLSRAGHHVTVLEKDPELTELGAGINMTHNAQRMFKDWGLFHELERYGIRYEYANVMSYHDGSEMAVFDHKFAYREMVIHRVDLLHFLAREARRCNVEIQLGVEIANVTSDVSNKPTITLSNGGVSQWDMILGADGERSNTRAMITGQDISQHDSGDHVFRMTLPLNEVYQDDELRHMVEPTSKRFWLGPGGNALTYPLKRGEVLNVVTMQEHSPGSVPPLRPTPVPIERVLDQYSDWDPLLRKLLGMGNQCLQWTVLQSDAVTKWTNAQGDMALVGDAAHPMPPFLSQGAAMGFEDAAVLGTLFSLAESTEDIPVALKLYEAIRKPRALRVRELTLSMRPVYNMYDGAEQKERDRKIKSGPCNGNPFFLLDPSINEYLFEYDVYEQARKAWTGPH